MGLRSSIPRGPADLYKFLGRRKAIKGGSGMACCSLSERCRIGRCFLQSLFGLVRIGWYMITRGIRLVLALCGRGCKDCS